MMTERVLGRGSVNTGAVEYVFRRPVRSWRDGRQITESALGKVISRYLSGLPNADKESPGRGESVTVFLLFSIR